jgi:hypothetical protein
MTGVTMMVMLGTAVWEGHPGAATRVLLPMGAAFAVLAVRERAATGWVLAGGLTVFSGVLALWHVPHDWRELDAGRFGGHTYLVRLDQGFFGVEQDGGTTWAWTAQTGTLAIEISPPVSTPRRVRLRLRATTPREVRIGDGDLVRWQGHVETRREWIEFVAKPAQPGRLTLAFSSDAAPVRENEQPDARELGFAVYEVELK